MAKKGGKAKGNNQGSVSFDSSKGVWRAMLLVGYTPEGKRRYVKSTHRTKSEAEEGLRKLHEANRTGSLAPDSGLALGVWLDRWLDQRPNHLAPNTMKSYRLTIDKHLKAALGGRKLSMLKPAEIESFYSSRMQQGLGRTVVLADSILRLALKEAERLGLLGRSPMDRVLRPRPQQRRKEEFHTPQQSARLLSSAQDVDDPALLALVLVGIETGARFSEIAGLTWEDIVFQPDGEPGAMVVFRQQLSREAGKWTRRELKTEKSTRAAFLSEAAAEVLEGQKLRQTVELMDNPLQLALLNERGNPWEQSHANRRLRKLCEVAKVPVYSTHRLFRHSYATRALKSGASLHDVSRALGHSTHILTGSLYGHHTLDAAKRTARLSYEALRFHTKK